MKILDATILAKVKYATLFAVSYLDRKGNARRWHLVSRGDQPKCISGERLRPDAAIIVPYHRSADKLVVIREFRIPVGDYLYGFPAGLLDPAETVAEAASRELREETGLELVRLYRHSPALFSSAGITDETISMVFAEVEGTPTVRNNADSEQIEVCLMDRREIRALLDRNDLVFSARAWLVMDAFAQLGKSYLMHPS